MPLDRQTVIDDIRSTDPEFFETWDDSKIFGFLQDANPELKFKPETEGAAIYRQYGAVEVPNFMERAAHQLETQWDEMNTGLYGMMPWTDIDAAENLRQYNKNLYKAKIADNIELQALTAWKEDEPGWTNLDTGLRSLSEAIPSLALAMTGTLMGVGLAKVTGGSSLMYSVASLAPMFAMESGAQYNEAMATLVDELGMDPEDARGYAQMTAVGYGAVASMLEKIGAQHYLRLVGIGRKASTDALRTSIAKRLVMSGMDKGTLIRGGTRMLAGFSKTIEGTLIEGSTEWLQAYTQNTINEGMRLGFGEDQMSVKGALQEAFKKTWDNPAVWEEGFAGATTGVLGFPFGAATSTQASKISQEEIAELQDADETDTKQVAEPGKFGGYLSALFDPDLMSNTLSDIKQGDEMGERMQFAEERIENIGKKILYVLGNNADSVNDLYNHPNKDILLAEVKEVFIEDAGLDEASGEAELRAFISHFVSTGRFIDSETVAQEGMLSEIIKDPTLSMPEFAEQEPSDLDVVPPTLDTKPTFKQLEKSITEARKNELIDAAEAGRKPKMSDAEKAWFDVVMSPEMVDAVLADFQATPEGKAGGSAPGVIPSAETGGPAVQKVISAFDKGVAAENVQITEKNEKIIAEHEAGTVINDPQGNYKKGQRVQLNIDPSTISNKKNQKALEAIGKDKTYAVVAVSETSIRLIELNSEGELSVSPTEQKAKDQIWIHKTLYKGKERQTDHLKIVGIGGKTYQTQYEKKYDTTYEETGRVAVEGKVVETKAQSDVDKMNPSQLLAKAKELGVKDQLPTTESGAVSKSAANIEKIKKIIKAAMPQPVQAVKPVQVNQKIMKDFVADGTVPEGVIQNMADKLAAGKKLTDNEIAMYTGGVGVKAKVEALLQAKKEGTEIPFVAGTPTTPGKTKSLIAEIEAEKKEAPAEVKAEKKAPETEEPTAPKEAFLDEAIVNLAMKKGEKDIPQSIINKYPDLAKKYGYKVTDEAAPKKKAPAAVEAEAQKKDVQKTGETDQVQTPDTFDDATGIPQQVSDLSVKELKKILKGKDQKTGGTKQALRRRLEAFIKLTASDQHSDKESVTDAELEKTEKAIFNTLAILVGGDRNRGAREKAGVTETRLEENKRLKAEEKELSDNLIFDDALEESLLDIEESNSPPMQKKRDRVELLRAAKAKQETGTKKAQSRKTIEGKGRVAPSTKKKTAPKKAVTEKKGLSDKQKTEFVKKRLAGEKANEADMTKAELAYYNSEEFSQDYESQKLMEDAGDQDFNRPTDNFDYQDEMDSNEKLASEDKILMDKILSRLQKHFPYVDVKTFEGLIKVYGRNKIGYATEALVAWSLDKGKLDTLPHEYAHIYVKLLRNEKIIKLALKQFKTEEALVQAIADYYMKRIRDKKFLNTVKVFLKQMVARLKRMFKIEPQNQDEVLQFIAEEFYQGRYLGIDVTVGDQWIGYQDENESTEENDEEGTTEDESDAPGAKQTTIPSGIKLTHFHHNVLGIYINNKFDYPIMMDLADKYKTYQEYEDALFEWAAEMAAERNFIGDENVKPQAEMTDNQKNKMKNEWSRIQSRIKRFSRTNPAAQGRDTRAYLEITLNYDEDTAKGNSAGMQPAGTYDKVNEKEFPEYQVRNFIEDDYINGTHDSRAMILPLKQITKRLVRKKDKKVFHKSSAPEMSLGFLGFLQRKAGLEYKRKFERQVLGIKARAMARAEAGLTEKENIKIILEDLEKMDKRGTLLSIIGSKLGDNAAIISTNVRNMPHTLTPEAFNQIIEDELSFNNINKDHAKILRKDSNYETLKNSKNRLVTATSFNEYAREKIDELGSINAFFDTLYEEMNHKDFTDMVEMSQSLAQLRWWQNVRTPDYFMYEKSAGDSMIRLSINLAEGPSPTEAGDMEVMIIDEDVQIGGKVWERDENGDWVLDSNGNHRLIDEEINADSLTYGEVDGASYTGTRYLSKVGGSLGYNVLQQLKTFIRQRDVNAGTGEVEGYIGMKHMMFAVYKGMKFYKNGELFAEVREDSNRLTYFYDVKNEKEFDMIASPNEAKMTFGKYASAKQKADAFGGQETDYDNGFYKTHTIKATSIKVTQVMDKSKWSASYPIAVGEMLLSLGYTSDEVKALLKTMRGRYVDIVNHYTEQMKSYYENPKLLADFIRKADKAGEIPDDLQKWVKRLGEGGLGIFHPALITHILPVLNSKLIKDGINKARGYKGEGTVLYLKPARNKSNSKHHHLMKDNIILSADNKMAFKKIANLIKEGMNKDDIATWDNLTKHEKLKSINQYLETHDVHMLIHRNPIAKVTGPVVRRVQALEEGLGQTTIMSKEDVKNILDGDWDGDKGALEFIGKTEIDAMLSWQNSEMFKKVDNIVSLKPFGKRIDDPTNTENSTVLSRDDVATEVHRNSKNDGATGVMMNGRTIMAQLFSKGLSIEIGKGKDKYTLTAADPLSEVVMDYIKIDPYQLTSEELGIISENGDTIVVYKDGKPTNKTVDITKGVTKYHIEEVLPADDETWHLKTTKGHEMSVLFQMAVDGNKFPFLGQIVAEAKMSNFRFMLSRIFQNNGTDVFSPKDLDFLAKLYAAQNLSRQRAGRTRSGLSTDFDINLSMSEGLHKMHNTRPMKDNEMLGDENGIVRGTRSDKKYAEEFGKAISHEISESDWQTEYGRKGYQGHRVADVTIKIKNHITPMESLLLMLGPKIKSSSFNKILTDDVAKAEAHILAMQELWGLESIEDLMTKAALNEDGAFTDAYEFIYKTKISWMPGLADNLQETVKGITDEVTGRKKDLNFANIWEYLMDHTKDMKAVQADTNKSFIDFTDLFIEQFLSLTPEAQAWTTLEFLGSRQGHVNILKLLPPNLMSDKIMDIYLPMFEGHLREIIALPKKQRAGARDIRKGGKAGGALIYRTDLKKSVTQMRKDHKKRNDKICKQ